MFAYSDAGDSLNDCRIMFLTEIYKIEEAGSLADAPAGSESPLKSRLKDGGCVLSLFCFSQHTQNAKWHGYKMMKCLCSSGSNGPECKRCKDDPKKNCQWCNCHICGIKQDPDKQLLCDECDMAYHTYCLNPPLTSIPDDEDWSVATDVWMAFVWSTERDRQFSHNFWKLPV